jgi:triosephosphate isomerase
LNDVRKIIYGEKTISLGAQDVWQGDGRSITGEIGSEMLSDHDVKYSIIGHSSRRDDCETDGVIAEKIKVSIKNGIIPILCVGEKERNEHGDFYNQIRAQLQEDLSKITKKNSAKIIIAYEPIWAIGKKESDAISPGDLHEMTIFIRKTLSDLFGKDNASAPILYGGSVSEKNAKEIFVGGGVSGLLIGRESLKPENFIDLIKEIDSIK